MACDSKSKLLEDIEVEGFFNALVHYDDYSAIPDPKFQELYQRLLATTKELAEHLGVEDQL